MIRREIGEIAPSATKDAAWWTGKSINHFMTSERLAEVARRVVEFALKGEFVHGPVNCQTAG